MPQLRPDRLRHKVRIQPITSREELTALAIATADLTIARDAAIATRDARVAEILDGCNIEIEELNLAIDGNVKRLRAWAVAHRGTAFEGKQSIEVAGHELAFRKGSGKVAFLPGVKAGDALDALLASEDDAVIDRFAKVSVALDKNAVIKACRESGEARKFLEGLGITVVVEEDFKFVPNRPDAAAITAQG